ELALVDLETVTGSLDRAQRLARSGDKEAIARVELLKRIQPVLNEGRPARTIEFTPEERKVVRGLGLITAKRVLYVANVDESDVRGGGPRGQKVRERAVAEGGSVGPVCAKIESELSELDESDRAEMH